MKFVLFYHSLLSDWNHGNAHFLRGVVTELRRRGHEVRVFEPRDSWSRQNLVAEHGEAPLERMRHVYPGLDSTLYDLAALDLDVAMRGADVVIVHEWNDHDLVARIGEHRKAGGGYRLLFHDTHHRSVTDRDAMSAYDLSGYDGALAFGETIRRIYVQEGWTERAWTWHEAADTRVFRPMRHIQPEGDLVWIGNWGDDERTAELHEYLLEPVRTLKLAAAVHGVRYPDHAKSALQEAGIEYRGWLPNYSVPETFARFRATVHVPRRPYVEALPGIPTIRPFEALACGIPLVSAPWDDVEGLFTAGKDFLVARDGDEMTWHLRRILSDGHLARSLAEHGLHTIRARHTCAHRVDQLEAICGELGAGRRSTAAA